MDPATIIALANTAILAVWIFFSTKYWPAQQQQRELDQAFSQKTRSEAFTQVLEINRSLVNNLIERSQLEERITAIDAKIDALRAEIAQDRVEAADAKVTKAEDDL